MLAARDQENLTYTQQRAAAAKPLNQAPKTPAPNGRLVSRRVQCDDENALFTGHDNKLNVGKGKLVPLQTPAPRDRQVLGAKTTNANAKPFRTPAPNTAIRQDPTKRRQLSASARKSKLKIHHQPEEAVLTAPVNIPADDSDGSSLPDIEYCPPKIQDLPDYPDPDDPYEIKTDEDFSMFTRDSYFRNAWAAFGVDEEDGPACDTPGLDRFALDEVPSYTSQCPKLDVESEFDHEASYITGPSQLESRSAAAALSGAGTQISNRFAQPTIATKAKRIDSAPKHRVTPGVAASHTSIGHARGRKVSSTLRNSIKSSTSAREREQHILDELCRETDKLNIFKSNAIQFDEIDHRAQ